MNRKEACSDGRFVYSITSSSGASTVNGGFDHADIHPPTDRLYVAHTSNDSIDVIDCARDRYVESIAGLTAVAGRSYRGVRSYLHKQSRREYRFNICTSAEQNGCKIDVGVKPNGLAFDSIRGILIVANVGDSLVPDSHSVSVVDVGRRERVAEIKVPGRTRWAIYDPAIEMFFVNIASPARIVAVDPRDPTKIAKEYEIRDGAARTKLRCCQGSIIVCLRCRYFGRN